MPPQQSALSVSLSRHQACRACRTRKIRCDAQRPACAPCVKWATSRGRDPDAVICSYDGDTQRDSSHDSQGSQDAVPLTTLYLGGDPSVLMRGDGAAGKNQVLEGRVAELESMLAQQSATLAALLPSVSAGADLAPPALTSLIGLPIARASSSSSSSPEASGDLMRPHRVSSVASSSGSSVFTNEVAQGGGHRRSSLDGAPFPPPFLSQLPEGQDGQGAPIAYPTLPSVLPANFAQAPLTVTTAVPLGPHSVACNDPNCPDYLRAREAAAMRMPQPLSLDAPPQKAAPLSSGPEPAIPNANACLSTILSDLGFATGIPSSSSMSPSPETSHVTVKMEDPAPPLSSLQQAPPPPPPMPHALPYPMPMQPFPASLMDHAAWGMAPPQPPPVNPPMEISPEVWSMLFPGGAYQHAAPPAVFASGH